MCKIAYLVDSTIPSQKANSVHAVKMSRAFSKIADVTLFCRKAANVEDLKILESYNVEKTFDIVTIKERKQNKINIILDGYKTALKVRKTKKFDFIYGRSALSVFFSRNIAPFMFESHEWPTTTVMEAIQKTMFKSKNFRGLVTISGELKEKYLAEIPFLKRENVYVLHDGADVARDNIEKIDIDNAQSESPDVVIGYLGHLYPGKCMEIVSKLAKVRPQYIFHIAGGTSELVAQWKEKLAVENIKNIVLYGFIENKDADKWYKAFDIFLLPLLSNIYVGGGAKKDIGKWISPLKLFEAMAYGKTIIASDLPTLREVVSHGEDGFLINPEDIEKWAETLDMLVANSLLREKTGVNAKKKLGSTYTWDIRAKKIIDCFKKA